MRSISGGCCRLFDSQRDLGQTQSPEWTAGCDLRALVGKVKKRNYFGKYGHEAHAVLEALLEKYADHGITDIEDPKILELPPFSKLGTKTQIRRSIFGGNAKYPQALTELEQAIYEKLTA